MPKPGIRHGSLLALVLMSLAPAGAPPAIGADVAPLIRILEPVDGAVVKSPVTVRVEVLNFTLQPPGAAKKAATGHIHYWVDNETNAMIYGPTPNTRVRLLMAPGHHKIRAELVYDDHTSLAAGYVGKKILTLPGDGAFERRPSMSTVNVEVR